jgi:cytochrome b subunit of formate dehydrogenase
VVVALAAVRAAAEDGSTSSLISFLFFHVLLGSVGLCLVLHSRGVLGVVFSRWADSFGGFWSREVYVLGLF